MNKTDLIVGKYVVAALLTIYRENKSDLLPGFSPTFAINLRNDLLSIKEVIKAGVYSEERTAGLCDRSKNFERLWQKRFRDVNLGAYICSYATFHAALGAPFLEDFPDYSPRWPRLRLYVINQLLKEIK